MICILDLGTSKISSILVKDEDLSPEVIAFSSVETSGIKTGSIINIGLISEDISKSINELENKSGEKIKDIINKMAHCNITKINGFLLTIAAIKFKSFKVLSNRTEGNQKVMYVTTTEAIEIKSKACTSSEVLSTIAFSSL